MSRAIQLSLADLAERISAIARTQIGRPSVFLPGGAMEAHGLQAAFSERPELANGVSFSGLFVPGVNRFDWAALHPNAKMIVAVPSVDWSQTLADGRTIAMPLHYSEMARWIGTAGFGVQIAHVSPIGSDGRHSLGFAGDVVPGALGKQTIVVGLINEAVPHVLGAPRVHPDQFDYICEHHFPLREAASGAEGPLALVKSVVDLVPNGATIQIGIGRLPGAILGALNSHSALKVLSGLISQGLGALLDGDVIANQPNAITCGLVLGDADFYARMAQEPRLQLARVATTHSAIHLAQLQNFTALNAALEIDLEGQINCEYAGTRQVSGVGGALDFMRGASLSPGGKAITMIQATGKNGASRVVPRLTAPTISIPRMDSDVVVSEFGVSHLRHLDGPARRQAIAGLAAPEHRGTLLESPK